MKRIIVTFTFLVCVFSFNLCAQTIYVDVANTTGIENGSQEHPFNTVIEGIDASSEQDTVYITHGMYNDGNILIEKAIYLIGEDMETTIINGELSVADTVGILPFSIQNLSFSRFYRFLYSKTSAPLLIKSCIFSDYIDVIKSVDSTASLQLADNIISDSVYIYNVSCGHDRVIKNCFIGGGLEINSISSKGIIIIKLNEVGGKTECSSVALKDSLFITDNVVNDSLKVYALSGPIVTVNNNVIGNTCYLYLFANHGMTIESNIIENGDLVSVSKLLEGSLIAGNDINNGGIKCTAKAGDVTIKENIIHPPGGATGIDVKSTSFGRIAENEIVLDYVSPSGLPESEDTTASCGIRITSVAIDSIYNNTIEGGTYGIYAKSVAMPLSGNTIKYTHHGIYAEAVACHLQNNHVTFCEGNGMILDLYNWEGIEYDSSFFYLYKNKIESNNNNGIVLRNYAILGDSANMTTSGENIFTNNNVYDLYIETPAILAAVIKGQRNTWDHTIADEIDDFDIYDGEDNSAVSVVDFEPFYISGIEDEQYSNLVFEIFPNPCSGTAFLRLTNNDQRFLGSARNRHLICDLYQISGQSIRRLVEEEVMPGDYEMEFDVSDLPAGVYFVRLQAESRVGVQKVIIK